MRIAWSTLPEDWGLSEELRRWLRERNIGDNEANVMLEAFIAHARATAQCHMNWDAAFRLWATHQKKIASKEVQPQQRTLANSRADITCGWTAFGTESRCEAPASVYYGNGQYLCAHHAGEFSKLNNSDPPAQKPNG